jgi:hypothetical protein
MYHTRVKDLQPGHRFVKQNILYIVTTIDNERIYYKQLVLYYGINGVSVHAKGNTDKITKKAYNLSLGKNSNEIVLFCTEDEVKIYFNGTSTR